MSLINGDGEEILTRPCELLENNHNVKVRSLHLYMCKCHI